MNDIKYVMLPRIEDKSKIIKPQPWYKERLREKYLTKNPSNNKEKLLDPKQWVFIKDGLDDFRDGLPPPHEDLLIKPQKGPAPTLKNESWKFKESSASPTTRFTVNQRCFSKKLPLAEAREDHINQIIDDLSKHPLALYSHLEDALPPDLFEEIVDILDPEINKHSMSRINESSLSYENKRSDSATSSKNENKNSEEPSQPYKRNIRDEMHKLEENLKKSSLENKLLGDRKGVHNTYKWLLKKEEAKAKAKGPEPEQLKAQAIDNHIKKVTEEFCEWVKSLGGEHNIDPVTLTSLFASGYDTKPPLSVPIHVVELTNIPQELRSSAYIPPDANNDDEEIEKTIFREEGKPKDNKYRYGAWYLGKEHWRLMNANEKLVDPKEKIDNEKLESRRRSEEINARMANLHAVQGFKDFVKSKKLPRVPKLVEEIDDWENEQSVKSTVAITNKNQAQN